MVIGTLSLVQKGQMSGCSKQWTQYLHSGHSEHSECSGILVFGGGDIVFGAKKVKPVDAVDKLCSLHSGCSGIVVYGGVSTVYCIQCIHCVLCDCVH